MGSLEACIFDLDGVIVDTAKWHYKAWNTIANKLDFQFTESENEDLKGISRPDSLDAILKIGNVRLSQKEKDALLVMKNDLYLKFIENINENEILPGVISFLKELKKSDIKIGLGSASRNAKKILDKTGVAGLFDSIIDGNDVVNSKPDPEVFLKGAQEMQVSVLKTVVFEDSQKGIEAALSGGFLSVGIGRPEILTDADFVILGFEDYSLHRFLTDFNLDM